MVTYEPPNERKIGGRPYLQHSTVVTTGVQVSTRETLPPDQLRVAARPQPVGNPLKLAGAHKGVITRPFEELVAHAQGTPNALVGRSRGTQVTTDIQQRPYDGAKRYLPGLKPPKAPRKEATRPVANVPILRPPVLANGVVTGTLRSNNPGVTHIGNAPATDRYNVLVKASATAPARVAMLDTPTEIQLVHDFVDRLTDNKVNSRACQAWNTHKQVQVWLTYSRGHLTQISLTRPLMSYIL